MAASSQWRCRAASGTAGHDERWKQSQSSRGEKQDMTGDDYEQGQGQRGVRTGMKGMETKQTSRQDRQRPQSRWERGRAKGQRKRYEGHRQTVWDLERPSGEKSHLKRQRRLWRYRMVNRWVSIWVFKNRDCFFFCGANTGRQTIPSSDDWWQKTLLPAEVFYYFLQRIQRPEWMGCHGWSPSPPAYVKINRGLKKACKLNLMKAVH